MQVDFSSRPIDPIFKVARAQLEHERNYGGSPIGAPGTSGSADSSPPVLAHEGGGASASSGSGSGAPSAPPAGYAPSPKRPLSERDSSSSPSEKRLRIVEDE